jgi:fructan beta-fructosidase
MKYTYRIRIIPLSIMALSVTTALVGCKLPLKNDNVVSQSSYLETFRPQLQYSTAQNWMNDPNGLVYYAGEYHLFYQYNPNGNGWGDMSWGHAVSTDLVHWEELPVALPVKKDADGQVLEMYFSGSAAMDINNTSHLGKKNSPAMVAMYTSYYPSTTTLENGKVIQEGTQAQSIAYSTDKGRTWMAYNGNPVIEMPPIGYEDQYREFRDPKIFWYDPEKKWVMVAVLSTQHKAVLYESDNMLDWSFMSEFGPSNAVGGVWECPDLFEIAVDDDNDNKKWVMVININPGAPAGGSGSQYFIGQFDGNTFTADSDSLYDNNPPIGSLVTDFEESSYRSLNWVATKDLYDAFLSTGDRPGQSGVVGFQGSQLLNTFIGGDNATGVITSPLFTITDNYINLLVGGGSHARDPLATLETNVPLGQSLFGGADFEGSDGVTYDQLGWLTSGDFVNQVIPTGAIGDQQAVSGFLGSRLANTFMGSLIGEGGDLPIGTLTSPSFSINKPYINFLLAGGHHPYGIEGATAVVLMVDGEVVRTATGQDSETLNWVSWNISEYIGKQATIVIIDENNSGWGHINVDNFIASDDPAQPVSNETTVNLIVDDKVIHSATGANSEILSWHSWNVANLQGKQAQIRIVDNNTGGWGHILVDHIVQSDKNKPIANWADNGADFYAAVSWNGVPNNKRVWLGWMSNWSYASSTPTSPWRSAQTFVRELSLKTVDNKLILSQEPTKHLSNLRGNPLFNLNKPTQITPDSRLLANHNVHSTVYEIQTRIDTTATNSVGFKLRTGNNGNVTFVGYDALAGEVFIDRTSSGDSSFSNSFAAKHTSPLIEKVDVIDFRIIVDTASVTVFANNGKVVLTDQIFPNSASDGMEIYTEGGSAVVNSLTIWPLESIWIDK